MRADNRIYPNLLIVEGADDRHSVVGLMQHHINWPTEPRDWPVYIALGGSSSEILADGYLSTELKASNVKVLGVVLDADLNAHGRYQRIQQLISSLFPTLPSSMPQDGLVIENLDGKRFGLWLMPDNQSVGDLEKFLEYLVPETQKPLWNHACASLDSAREKGAGCRDSHMAKASLYTWLAWQDPPGQSPGLALTRTILHAKSVQAVRFVAWFKELYKLG